MPNCFPPHLQRPQVVAAEAVPEAPPRNEIREPSNAQIMREASARRKSDAEVQDEKAARLFHAEGLSRAVIGIRMDKSQGWVTKALRRWKQRGGKPSDFAPKASAASEPGIPVRSAWAGGRGGFGSDGRNERIPSLNASWDTVLE